MSEEVKDPQQTNLYEKMRWNPADSPGAWGYRPVFCGQDVWRLTLYVLFLALNTVKPVCNYQLSNKIYYLWFIQ